MIIPLEKALNIIGERTSDNHLMLKQARRQRRTEYTDIYGVPFESEISDSRKSEFHLFISPDIEYWERFQFKLFVADAPESGFDENGFTFKIIELNDDGSEASSGDISAELAEQHGSWIDGNGFFPSEEISDEGADAEDFFDILYTTTTMWNRNGDGDRRSVKRILNGGTKLIRITAPVSCKVTFIPYIKYSTVNR